MKRLLVGLVAAGALLVTACSKDAEVEEFMKENEALAKEVKSKGEKDGPEAAKKAFDAKKDDLKKKYDAIKDARGFQVKEETMTKLSENLVTAAADVCTLQITTDEDKSKAFRKICDDYGDLFK